MKEVQNYYFTERLSNLPETLQLKGGLQKKSHYLHSIKQSKCYWRDSAQDEDEERGGGWWFSFLIYREAVSITHESIVYYMLGLKFLT